MKTLLTSVMLVIGLVLVAFGNDWGLLGLIPALWHLMETDREDVEEERAERW
jgi:hypothetical protein